MRFNEIQIINEALKQHTTGGAYPQEDMEAVGQLQHILMILGYDVGSAGVDGKQGPTTAKAVASFKRDYGVPGPGSMFGPKALAEWLSSESLNNNWGLKSTFISSPIGL